MYSTYVVYTKKSTRVPENILKKKPMYCITLNPQIVQRITGEKWKIIRKLMSDDLINVWVVTDHWSAHRAPEQRASSTSRKRERSGGLLPSRCSCRWPACRAAARMRWARLSPHRVKRSSFTWRTPNARPTSDDACGLSGRCLREREVLILERLFCGFTCTINIKVYLITSSKTWKLKVKENFHFSLFIKT